MLSSESKVRLINRQLQSEEGYREFPYNDKTGERIILPDGGNITLGMGFNASGGCPVDLAQIIANYFVNKADAQLSKDLDFYDDLDEVRKCVILDMSFQMGVHGAEAFKDSMNLIREKFYNNAAAKMRKSLWYEKFPHRAEPLCVEMETGQWMPIAA